jgi:nicotinate-nucleotide pyrophosphorylase (carboxylating)
MTQFTENQKLIKMALSEDLGKGDITTDALHLRGRKGQAFVVSKGNGVISGLDPFMRTFKLLSNNISFKIYKPDGATVVPDDKIIEIKGPLDAILTGERTAMNFLCLLSGVATSTRKFANAVKGYPAKLLDTRKTVPGMRMWQKKAVKDGNAINHRLGLFDMYLIKENHIAAAGGLAKALENVARHRAKTGGKIEVEVKNLDELKIALPYKPDYILLDNFSNALLRKAVKIAKKNRSKVLLEASGNVSLKTVRKIAATGVDRISVGSITHSAPVLDLSMKVKDLSR